MLLSLPCALLASYEPVALAYSDLHVLVHRICAILKESHVSLPSQPSLIFN